MQALDTLVDEIERKSLMMNKRKGKYRLRSKLIKTSTIIIGALITVITGVASKGLLFGYRIEPLIIIFGAVVTVINVWSDFSSYSKLWTSNTVYRDKLDHLLVTIKFEKVDGIEEKEIYEGQKLEFFRIMKEYNKAWINIRKDNLK